MAMSPFGMRNIDRAITANRTGIRGVRLTSEHQAVEYATSLEYEIEELRRSRGVRVGQQEVRMIFDEAATKCLTTSPAQIQSDKRKLLLL